MVDRNGGLVKVISGMVNLIGGVDVIGEVDVIGGVDVIGEWM